VKPALASVRLFQATRLEARVNAWLPEGWVNLTVLF
jgi:hypothetical protein